jgi:hypothetical protein
MHGSADDSLYAAMQERGGMAMGVNQYSSHHTFDITNDGGRIALQNDADDSLAVAQIRAHLRLIQHAFEAGDFSTPAFVHRRDMPGTMIMTKKRSVIKYIFREIPRGGEIRIVTTDAEARSAIAEFLEAQKSEHRASGTGPASH